MARLENNWHNTKLEVELNTSVTTVVDIPITSSGTSIRSYGHWIGQISALYLHTNQPSAASCTVRWGIYYGPEGENNLNLPNQNGNRWLVMGAQRFATQWNTADPGDVPLAQNQVVKDWDWEIKSMRRREFGSGGFLQLQLVDTVEIFGNILNVRGYTRVLQFNQPA